MDNKLIKEPMYMRHLKKFFHILLALFIILTIFVLLLGLLDSHKDDNLLPHIMPFIVLGYLILLYIIIATLIICVVIGAAYTLKHYGLKTFLKETILSLLGAFVIVIIISLLKDKMLLNRDSLFLLFVFPCFPSLRRFYSIDRKE